MKNNLIIIGASGHGKVVAEIAERVNRYERICFIDDYSAVKSFHEYRMLGNSDKMNEFKDSAEFFVAIGNNETRKAKYQYLIEKNYHIATLIDPNAVISKSVQIGLGTVIMPGAIVNASSKVGIGCIINTKVSIDHDCQVDDFVHISPGATIAGTVDIGKETWIGAGTTIINNITLKNNIVVGAGSLVIRNIDKPGTYFGNPTMRKE